MSNETFQTIITASVGLAILSMIVQGLVVVALFRTGRSIAAKVGPILARSKALLAVEADAIRRLEIVIDKTLRCADILERVTPRARILAARVDAVAMGATQLGVRATELERSCELVETSIHFMALDTRPRVVAVAAEGSALIGSASTQLRRVSGVFRDAIMHYTHLREVVKSI